MVQAVGFCGEVTNSVQTLQAALKQQPYAFRVTSPGHQPQTPTPYTQKNPAAPEAILATFAFEVP